MTRANKSRKRERKHSSNSVMQSLEFCCVRTLQREDSISLKLIGSFNMILPTIQRSFPLLSFVCLLFFSLWIFIRRVAPIIWKKIGIYSSCGTNSKGHSRQRTCSSLLTSFRIGSTLISNSFFIFSFLTNLECVIWSFLVFDFCWWHSGFLKYLRQHKVPLNEYEFPQNKIANVQSQVFTLV